MKSPKSFMPYMLLAFGILVLVNILGSRFFLRLDFTADERYTLSRATKDILKSLEEPVTVTAYFSEDLPPDIAKTRRDFKELLVEYNSISKGQVVYEFINPGADEQQEQKAMQSGIQPVIVNVREKDQMKQQKAYLGAVIQLGEKREVIPFMQPGAAMEYSLSSSIRKITSQIKPTIGFLQGHGEPKIAALQQANASLAVLYQVEEVTLNESDSNLSRFKTIAIVNPLDSFPENHLLLLDNYLANGGNLYIAAGRVKGELSKASGESLQTGLEVWLAKKGIQIENSFIIDANCGSVSVRQQQGAFSFNTNIGFPYFPMIKTFESHPAVKGLETAILQFASPINYTGDSGIVFTSLARTSTKTGTQAPPLFFDVQKQWSDRDFPLSNLIVAAAFTGRLSGNTNSRMVLVSSGSFAVNGEGQNAMQLPGDNVNLLVNGIDWLSDDTGLIDLRTKGVSSRPLDQVEDSTKILIKYMNFLLPVVLIIIYGFVRMQLKRNLRIRRMEENYI